MRKLISLGQGIKDIYRKNIASSYFLYGNDIFMQDFFISEFKRVKKTAKSYLYYLGYDEQNLIFDELSNISLFDTEKIIIIKNINKFSIKSKNYILEYLSKPNSNNYLILIKNNFDSRNKFVDSIIKKSTTIDVRTPFDNKVIEWIKYITKKKKIDINDSKIIDYVNAYGHNISNVMNYIEIDSLSVKKTSESNRVFYLWHFQDSIGKKKLVESIDIYQSLLSNGTSINLILIYLFRLYEFIYNHINNNKIMTNNFAINKIIQSRINIYSKKYSIDEIENIILKLKELDFLSKNSNINNSNINRCLITNICKGYYE